MVILILFFAFQVINMFFFLSFHEINTFLLAFYNNMQFFLNVFHLVGKIVLAFFLPMGRCTNGWTNLPQTQNPNQNLEITTSLH